MSTGERTLVGGRVVTPSGVLDDGWIAVAAGRIAATGAGAPAAGPVEDLHGAWVVPGFVDLHMHGGGGFDVTASREAMAAAVAFHRSHGTTSTIVSLVTAPLDDLAEQLGWVADLAERGATSGGCVLGSHLEGPFLSEKRCGAQNAAHLRDPDPDELARLVAAGRGALRVVTLAPELPGALDLVKQLAAAGVIPALGHSDATYAQARAAIEAGAALATHLFNGMRPLHHREPGLIGAALHLGIPFELINDGLHLHPALVSLLTVPGRRPVLVTDAINAAGAGDGEYFLGGQPVDVVAGEARLRRTGSLAGSTLTMDSAFRRAVRDSGLTMTAAALAAATDPATLLGVAGEIGSLAPGRRADLVVLDDDLCVFRVMVNGVWADGPEAV
jgi:N-acetylglucosamine-6-phosphate deacetylase